MHSPTITVLGDLRGSETPKPKPPYNHQLNQASESLDVTVNSLRTVGGLKTAVLGYTLLWFSSGDDIGIHP